MPIGHENKNDLAVPKKRIALALQGGSAHGAMTWGVLDRLLEEESIEITAISGTSSGAINAAVMLSGLGNSGVDGAKERLEKFWYQVSEMCSISPLQPNFFDKIIGMNNMAFWPAIPGTEWLQTIFTPYHFNFFDTSPLRDILDNLVDLPAIKKTNVQFFINSCQVTTGNNKIFPVDTIKLDHLLASACLPYILQNIEIDGSAYWDGLFVSNPSINPLIKFTQETDILLVRIIPLECVEVPKQLSDIIDRADEVSSNRILLQEVQMIQLMNELISNGAKRSEQNRYINMHLIENDAIIRTLSSSSKIDGDCNFLNYMKEVGRQTADDWIKQHSQSIGKESTWTI